MLQFVFILLAVIAAASVVWANASLAPWVPTRRSDLERIRQLAGLGMGDIFYDLGCGDGKVALYMANQTGVKSIGIELSFPFWLVCLARKILRAEKNVKFKWQSLYRANLAEADAVYVFAGSQSKLKGRLKHKLERELKHGAKVISYIFPIEGWQADKVDKPDETSNTIYLYRIV